MMKKNRLYRKKAVCFVQMKLLLYQNRLLKICFKILGENMKKNIIYAFIRLKETRPKLKEKDLIINTLSYNLKKLTAQEKLSYLDEKKKNLEECINKYNELVELNDISNDIIKEKIYLKKIIKNTLIEIEEIKLCFK
jgi:hypothetical protein